MRRAIYRGKLRGNLAGVLGRVTLVDGHDDGNSPYYRLVRFSPVSLEQRRIAAKSGLPVSSGAAAEARQEAAAGIAEIFVHVDELEFVAVRRRAQPKMKDAEPRAERVSARVPDGLPAAAPRARNETAGDGETGNGAVGSRETQPTSRWRDIGRDAAVRSWDWRTRRRKGTRAKHEAGRAGPDGVESTGNTAHRSDEKGSDLAEKVGEHSLGRWRRFKGGAQWRSAARGSGGRSGRRPAES